jgi:4'-phosphopantetheinyl transferase
MDARSNQRPEPLDLVVRWVRTADLREGAATRSWEENLSEDELWMSARLRSAEARRDYLAAHALARALLAELSGADPSRLVLQASPAGRPELILPRSGSRFHFSISHADGIALCAAAAGCEVGVDVESLGNLAGDPLGVAEIVCSPEEMRDLLAVRREESAQRLLVAWTVKEAIAKATGLGFRLALDRITVHAETDTPPWVELDPDLAAAGSRWWIASLRLTPRHTIALAVRDAPSDEVSLTLEEIV